MATPQAPRAAEWRQPSKHDSVIIVGAGAFGLSTALHLLQDGYTDVTVLERGDEIPSRYSAANDINKIIRAEYEDPFYRDLTLVSCNLSHTEFPPILASDQLLTNKHRKPLKTAGASRSSLLTTIKQVTSSLGRLKLPQK